MWCSRLSNAARAVIFAAGLLLFPGIETAARGPLLVDGEPVVTIYRDFDDGLFGRSLYRGILYSVRIDSFARYRTLPVGDLDGLTGYLLAGGRARQLAAGGGVSVTRIGPAGEEAAALPAEDPARWTYAYERAGTRVVFALESAPEDLYAEVDRTYAKSPTVAEEVKTAYRDGYVIRVLEAENVWRPETARIDYEDVLISASLIGDRFQPLWGIHDGNDATGG